MQDGLLLFKQLLTSYFYLRSLTDSLHTLEGHYLPYKANVCINMSPAYKI